MALEALSNAVYHDTAKQAAKPRVETTTGQDTSATTINITELPGTSRVTGNSQTGKEQNNTQNNGQNGQGSGQKEGIASGQQIKSAISQANSKLRSPHRTRCEFSYHEETKRVSIKVLDNDTQEVIREIPPEETLEMVQKMWELAGLIVDEKR
jgi:flagellar protein FlaG